MMLDALNRYSNSQALTATAVSTDVIDHGSDRDLGIGEPMDVAIFTETVADDANADETYTAILQTDTVEGFGSPDQVGQTITIARGTVAGSRFVIAIPPDDAMQRFSRLSYTLGGTTPSVTVSAYMLPRSFLQNEGVFPGGFTVQ